MITPHAERKLAEARAVLHSIRATNCPCGTRHRDCALHRNPDPDTEPTEEER